MRGGWDSPVSTGRSEHTACTHGRGGGKVLDSSGPKNNNNK